MNKVLFVVIVAAVAFTASARRNPREWTRTGRAVHGLRTNFIVSLNEASGAKKQIENIAMSVSDPFSPSYGQYLTKDQVRYIVSPGPEAQKTVSAWLKEQCQCQSAVILSAGHYILAKSCSMDALARELQVSFHRYVHKEHDGWEVIRTSDEIRLPSVVAPYVHFLSGVNDFPLGKQRKLRSPRPTTATVESPFIQLAEGFHRQIQITTMGLPKGASWVQTRISFAHLNSRTAAESNMTAPNFSSSNCSPSSNNESFCQWSVSGLEDFTSYSVGVTVGSSNGSILADEVFPVNVTTTEWVTPKRLRDLYNIPQSLFVHNSDATQAVGEGNGPAGSGTYNPKDLKTFLNQNGLPYQEPIVRGSTTPNDPAEGEMMLDIEVILGVAFNSTTYIVEAIEGQGSGFLPYFLAVFELNPIPRVNSLSDAAPETYMIQNFGLEYTEACNNLLATMATMGITFSISSGDAGACSYGRTSDSCFPSLPQFPASSPWATTVSASYINANNQPICYDTIDSMAIGCSVPAEIAVSQDHGTSWTTGGGFSNLTFLARPTYQAAAVAQYLQTAPSLPVPDFFNQEGRAYPDITTNGWPYVIRYFGQNQASGGTSASAPTLAAIFTLINDALIAENLPVIGFPNPLLYALQNSGCFTDIVVGSNRCGQIADGKRMCCEYGYDAIPGYDPVTGLGTPDFECLKDHAIKAAKRQLAGQHPL